jgi:hypothetical protein
MPYDLSACGLVTVSDFLVQDSQTTGNGVVLRNGDRPLITRGWDCFTSGPKTGIGRWGLFMEAAETFVAAPGTDYTSGKVGLGGFLADGTKQNTLTATTDTRRVGIGTCAPEAPLHIRCDSTAGSAFLRILTCSNNAGRRLDINAGTGIEYTIPDGTSQSPYIQIEGGSVPAGGGSFRIRTGASGTGAADRLTVTQGGNVGIATTSPRYPLDVAGGMMSNFYMSCCNTTIDGAGPFDYGIIGTGDRAGALVVNDITGARYSIHGGNYNLTFRKSVRGTTTACAYCTVMTFVGTTDTNCVVNVNVANYLGVGLNPTERLEIGGTTGRFQSRTDTNGTTLNIRPNAGQCGWISYTEDAVADRWGVGIKNGDSKLYFASGNIGSGGGTTRMVLDGGCIGIGTSSPGTDLEVYGTDAEIMVHNQSNSRGGFRALSTQRLGVLTTAISDDLVFGYENGHKCAFTERMRICNTNGRVGIGITTPSYLLHVNGTFYAAGSSQDYKEGICQYDTDSCLFMCLKPKTYQYKDEWKHLGKDLKSETQIGLIAEEVAESHPELAILVNEEDNKVVRNVDYEKLSIVLLAEVQKLRQEVDQLKNK